ncbi:MAG: hypothetical protein WCF61_19785 [Terriglobales bacterium]
MAAKKNDSTAALVAVVAALEDLNDADRHWVLQSAASKFTLTVQTAGGGGQAGAANTNTATVTPLVGTPTAADVQAAITRKDPRAFIRLKKPTTDVQRVACIGYYLVQTTGHHGFTSKDISTAYTDSGGSKINMTRALDNATRAAKYLSNRGPREKQLTTLGEDVVNALPDQAAVKNIEAAAKGGRGGKKGRKGKAAKKA